MLSLQLIDILNVMVVTQMNELNMINIPREALGLFQFFIIILINIVAFILVRRFVKDNFMFFSYTFAVLLSIAFVFLGQGPIASTLPPADLKMYGLLGIGFQIVSLIFILSIVFIDIFRKRHDLTYCLSGAACIFLLIGTVFAALYAFIEVCSPGALTKTAYDNVLVPSLTYSFYIISGQDPVIQDAGPVIRNLSIFESIFSNLYAVMVVGRLLTK